VYDYVPSAYFDGTWRLFWGGSGVAGDFVYQRTSLNPNQGWSPLGVALAPNYGPQTFDGQHTCDPSVIRIGNVSYLYYGGFPTANSYWPKTTQIGVATSTDGVRWVRQNGGLPIIPPHGNPFTAPDSYGAGQPSAIYVAPYVYMLYHDSTGAASNRYGGSYIIRSTDPLFRGPVEELSYAGGSTLRFVWRNSVRELKTDYAQNLASADWAYSDVLGAFIIAFHGVLGQTNLDVFDASLSSPTPLARLAVRLPVSWIDGPGITRRADGHALPHASGSSSLVPIILFYASGTSDQRTWDLRYVGVDLVRY
jgi:hypothetical protein